MPSLEWLSAGMLLAPTQTRQHSPAASALCTYIYVYNHLYTRIERICANKYVPGTFRKCSPRAAAPTYSYVKECHTLLFHLTVCACTRSLRAPHIYVSHRGCARAPDLEWCLCRRRMSEVTPQSSHRSTHSDAANRVLRV